MADTIVITDEDRIEAENVMEQYLGDAIPEGDYTKGGALRDLVIGALAHIYAYMKKERDYVRAHQSLLLLGTLIGTTDVDDAADEILSNWFIRRKTGRESTGTVTVYLSEKENVTVPSTTRFFKTPELQFIPNSVISLTFGEDDLRPLANSSGEIVAYSFDVPLIAVGTGTDYDIEPGPFADFTKFASSITRVENANTFSGGGNTETTTSLLERSETAITVRDLNSARSIDTVLKEEFSSVDDVAIIGYGDPEMSRDLILEEATSTRIHAGGHVDAYLRSPITYNKTFTGEVGALFSDPRPGYYILRDDTIADFSTVNVGDIIEVYNYLPASEGNRYVVKDVTAYGLYVSPRSPFPTALPEIEGSFDDGAVTIGGSQLESLGHAFAVIESTFDDGVVGSANPNTDEISSASYTFTEDDVGKWVRIQAPATNAGTWKVNNVSTGNAKLVDFEGAVAVFSDETGLTWDLMTATDLNKFVTVYGSAGGSNDGTWKIVGIVDPDYVELKDVNGNAASFAATETGLDWKLLTRIVEYSVGKNPPHYNDKISRRFSGQFTKTIQNDGRILLPAEPIYRITDVSFPSTGIYSIDGRVTFPVRSNTEPTYVDLGAGGDVADLQYHVIGHNPGEIPSGWQVMELDIGWPDGVPPVSPELKSYFNTQQLRVTYDTLTGYDAVWAYMLSGDQRILCGSVIPKGLHPVYIHMTVNYRLAKTATEALDIVAAAAGLAVFINNFDTREDLDASDITAYLRENFVVLGYIRPVTIYYDLLAPDGRVIYYKTTDTVAIDTDNIIVPATDTVTEHAPATNEPLYRYDEPIADGVSDNTIRYLTVSDLITFTEVE